MRFVSPLIALAIIFFSAHASAHQVGLSRGEYAADGNTVRATIVLASSDAALVDAAHAVEVSGCARVLEGTESTEADGLRIRLRFDCPAAAHRTIDARFIGDLSEGHRHLAHAQGADLVLDARHRTIDLEPHSPPPSPTLKQLIFMGIEHILTGWDHLAFLLGLLLLCGRLRSLALTISAFTVAHSITLGLAAFGVWSPPSRIIEPAIALSIAWVGMENLRALFRERASFVAEKRWRITFPFGLVHGFGFASALGELGMSRADVPKALFGFNAGVELGQLAVVVPLALAIGWIGKRGLLPPRAIQIASGAIVMLGLVWFTLRIA